MASTGAIATRHRRDPPLSICRVRKDKRCKLVLPTHVPVEVRLGMKNAGRVTDHQHGTEVKLQLYLGHALACQGIVLDDVVGLSGWVIALDSYVERKRPPAEGVETPLDRSDL